MPCFCTSSHGRMFWNPGNWPLESTDVLQAIHLVDQFCFSLLHSYSRPGLSLASPLSSSIPTTAPGIRLWRYDWWWTTDIRNIQPTRSHICCTAWTQWNRQFQCVLLISTPLILKTFSTYHPSWCRMYTFLLSSLSVILGVLFFTFLISNSLLYFLLFRVDCFTSFHPLIARIIFSVNFPFQSWSFLSSSSSFTPVRVLLGGYCKSKLLVFVDRVCNWWTFVYFGSPRLCHCALLINSYSVKLLVSFSPDSPSVYMYLFSPCILSSDGNHDWGFKYKSSFPCSCSIIFFLVMNKERLWFCSPFLSL